MDEPLIWTSKGNMKVSDLEYVTTWDDAPTYIKLIETYKHDGEVVKQSAHVYVKQGLMSLAEQETF